jgi:MshEN domain
VGDILVERGILTAGQYAWARDVQQRTGSPLETILVASGLVHRQYLYWLLGELWHASYLDLTHRPLDRALLAGLEPDRLVAEGWVPVRRLADGRVLAAGSRPPGPALLASIERALGAPVDYALTTDWDLRYALQRSLRDEDLPSYTVLAPMFREANVFHELLENLAKLDYPPGKLEILLLLERTTPRPSRLPRPPSCRRR